MAVQTSQQMRIGELARQAGVTTRTVRHYEQLGLLRPHERASSGYRYYSDAELARLRKIDQLKNLGLSLEEIRQVIDLYFDDPSGVQGKRTVLVMLRRQLREARRRREGLQRLEAELEQSVAKAERLLAEAGARKADHDISE